LLTISDDSWFDQSIALAQHLQMTRMRSLETGRYQMANSNTGYTAIIDNFGNVTSIAPAFIPTTLTATVQPMSGSTPWVMYGKYWWVLLLLLCGISFIYRNHK
jgi:apolipoprotein N-acyltransferase